MSLVAGSLGQTRVYDREAFEATVGDDLPWTTAERVARFAVEYRNDLLGHFPRPRPHRPAGPLPQRPRGGRTSRSTGRPTRPPARSSRG